MIFNMDLKNNEIQWLEAMLSNDFIEKNILIQQINHAHVIREITPYFLSLKFDVHDPIAPLGYLARVPVEMHVYWQDRCPIQFLLHVVNGFVSELEVFCADSSEISENFDLKSAVKIEVALDDRLK